MISERLFIILLLIFFFFISPGGRGILHGCDLAFFGDDHEVRELTDIHIDASLTYDLRILYQLYKYFQYSKSRVILRP